MTRDRDPFPGSAKRRQPPKCCEKPQTLAAFSVVAHYGALLQDLQDWRRRHATCAAVRAAAGIDRQLDQPDLRTGRNIGRTLKCPTWLVWGSDDLGKRGAQPLRVWQGRCSDFAHTDSDPGHYLAAENLQATVAASVPPRRAAHGGG